MAGTSIEERLYDRLVGILGKTNVSDNDLERFVYSGSAGVSMPPRRVIGEYGPGSPPAFIVWPETTRQVVELVHLANKEKIPLVPMGGSVGLRGGSLPLSSNAIVVDIKKMHKILDIHPDAMTITVQAGIVRPEMDEVLAAKGFWFPHDPPSHPVSAIGGFISTAAAGWWLPKYGYMGDLLLALEVVLPTGQILRTKPVMKHSVGPNLNWLFVGAAGTLGIITEATLKIYPLPEARHTRVYTFDSFHKAYWAAYEINKRDLNPYVMRVGDDGHSKVYLGRALQTPELTGFTLVVGFDGMKEMVELQDRLAREIALRYGGRDWGLELGQRFWDTRLSYWKQRKSTEYSTDVITTAATFDKIESLYTAVRSLYDRLGVHFSIHIPHFTPKGASLYCIFKQPVSPEGLELNRRVWEEGIPLVLQHGGTLEHHHEIGYYLSRYVSSELGTGLEVLRAIKKALDPNNILNPGKLAL
jgi:alkyldihydroxyacetonephosphate synthase